ncbi:MULTISPECIES: Uma2 family endonuclease [Spirulina sp. CCY15215]|uniref:Uma2 family endonuclease n=1 Tax=Spirulina sp. CCY15215 TaxID=2767591 RepID=UPI00194DD63E|nr:Uma2 family endonuclease [Spirulina major]
MTFTVAKSLECDRLLTFYEIGWPQFQSIEAAFEDVAGIRFIYLDGILEIMTLSPEHEEYKKNLGMLLETYLRESEIRFYGQGSFTLGGEELQARKEPDESYSIGTKKAMPDLAIEVVLTSGGINKLKLYQRLGVGEVWFWEDGVLSIYILREKYERVQHSELLPDLDLELLQRYITYHDQYDAIREFTQALRDRH